MRIILGMILGILFANTAFASSLTITSSAFKNLESIPIVYTCDGENISPPLAWTGVPDKTKSFVLVVYNPDAPYGTYYNWIIYSIPSSIRFLPKGANTNLPTDIQVGKTSSGDTIYRGPCPPNAAIHHYIFKLYAVDSEVLIPDGADSDEVYFAIKKHIISEAELVGTYNH